MLCKLSSSQDLVVGLVCKWQRLLCVPPSFHSSFITTYNRSALEEFLNIQHLEWNHFLKMFMVLHENGNYLETGLTLQRHDMCYQRVRNLVICPQQGVLWSPGSGHNEKITAAVWRLVVARENARPRQSIQASLSLETIHSMSNLQFYKNTLGRLSWEHVIANLAGLWPGYIWIVTASYNQFMFKKSPGSIFKSVNIEADPSIINHRSV